MKKNELLIYNGCFFALSETFIYRQVAALAKKYKVTLIAYEYINEHVYDFSLCERITLRYYTSFFDRILSAFSRYILQNNLVFSYGTQNSLMNLFKQKCNKAIIHAHYGWSGLSVLPFAKANSLPLVVSFHGKDASGALRDNEYRRKLPELFDYSSAIILCSPHMFDMLGLGEWEEKVFIVPYGVDVNYFKPYSEIPENNKIKILHIGRLTAKKGVPDLIKVFLRLFSEYKNIELHIVGDGEEVDLCKHLIEENNNAPVIFHGAKSQETVKNILAQSDIFVLNSRTAPDGDMEGFPNVILEAMSSGKPVVSTRHAGIPLAVEDNATGFIVDEFDNENLYLSIKKLIANKNLRELMGKNAREKILKHFSIETMNNNLLNVFNKVH